MSISKAFVSAQFANTGAPAAIAVSNEGVHLSATVNSLDFRGNLINATMDEDGNVVVNISNPQTIDKVDGGTF